MYRDIRLVSTAAAVVSYVVPQIFLREKAWEVKVAAYLQCKQGATGEVVATLETGASARGALECFRDGEARVDLLVTVP